MPTLLHIDSSPMGDYSVSRHLSAKFVAEWKAANPGGTVITRDLSKTAIAPLDAAWVAAAYTPADALTDEQKATLALSDELIAELFAADAIVAGLAMHNFSVPSTFKLWIDQVARVNKTFSYATGTPVGLLTGKKATFTIATGGVYGEGTAMASYNFVEPYVRTVFGFLGVTDVTSVVAGGAGALMQGANREEFLKPYEEAVGALFSK